MNQELKKIARWLCANKLSLNIKKTHFIIFKSKKRKLNQTVSIKINEQPIELAKYTKFLGVCIDEELSWKHHIDQVVSKISKMTGIMAKVRHYLSLKTLQTIYYRGERNRHLNILSPYFFLHFSPTSLIFWAIPPSSLIFRFLPDQSV